MSLHRHAVTIFLIGIVSHSFGIEKKVEQGVIDLSGGTFTTNIPLEGEWQFYWDKLIDANSADSTDFELITVPSSWTDTYPNFGFATFRVRILLPKHHQNLCVQFTNVKSAYKIWMNGEFVQEIGRVGSESTHVGTYQSAIVQLPPNASEVELLVHVSNYSQFQSGILSPPLLGLNQNMVAGYRNHLTIKIIFLCSLFLLSLYCLLQFFIYNHTRSYLYLFFICWCVGIRAFTSSGIYLVNVPLSMLVRLEFVAVFALVIFFPLYVVKMFADSYKKWALSTFLVSGGLLIAVALTTSYSFYRNFLNVAHVFFVLEFIYAGIIVKRNLHKNRAKFIVLGLLLSLPFLILEVLRNSGIIILQVDFLLELGVLLFLSIQGLLLHYQHQKELAEIKVLNKELDEFLYRTSHDLRTPIVGIRGLCNLMEIEASASPTVLAYNSQIKKSIASLDDLLKNIRIISANSKETVQAEIVDFNDIVRKSVSESCHIDPTYKIEIDVSQADPFYGDTERLKVIFQNLIVNAMAFGREGVDGKLVISCLVDSSTASISFKDNGIGIADDQREKVFQMFYRGSEKSKGVGLGLYIAKAIIDKLRAQIHLKSSPNEGAEFLITIPNGRAA